jgi:hypothetical protein
MEEEDFSDAQTETGCPTPASVNIDVPSHVILRVDGRVYHTTVETLMGRSDYFKRLFLGSLDDNPSDIHLDTDPRALDTSSSTSDEGFFRFCSLLHMAMTTQGMQNCSKRSESFSVQV